jgi:hypothetical protein
VSKVFQRDDDSDGEKICRSAWRHGAKSARAAMAWRVSRAGVSFAVWAYRKITLGIALSKAAAKPPCWKHGCHANKRKLAAVLENDAVAVWRRQRALAWRQRRGVAGCCFLCVNKNRREKQRDGVTASDGMLVPNTEELDGKWAT